MDKKQSEADREYADKKISQPIPLSDGLNHEITEEQKRVNLKRLRLLKEQGA